nr:FHA domain-containing protein [Chloroflexota bacterium]
MSHPPPARRAPRAASRWLPARAGLLTLALLAALLAPAGTAPAADNAAAAGITDIDLSAFPQISALVAVSDTQGNRVPDLPAGAFGLDENGIPVTLSQVSEEQIGLEIAFVIESSAVFSKRDPSALTRLDYVKTAIINFAVGNGRAYMKDSLDDVSLLTPEGLLLTHATVGGEIRNALISYQSQFKFDTGLFDLIRQAMDTVSAGGLRPGARRIVVLFSSGIDPTADAEVAAITARAAAKGITFHTILVGPPGSPAEPAAENLQGLATLTHGSYRFFEDPDSLDSLWSTLVTQREQYRLVYRSAIKQSGQHTLQALVTPPAGAALASDIADFSLTLQPPAAALTGLPSEIVRATDQRGVDPAALDPRAQPLGLQVVFPDGHPRALVKAQLLVDNAVAAETTGPFDTLTWDLGSYTQTGSHLVQVLVFDELGLEGRSEVTSVLVTVSAPPPLTNALGPALLTLLGIAVAGMSVAALALAIFVVLRRPAAFGNLVQRAGQRVRDLTEPFLPVAARPPQARQGKSYLEIVDDGSGQSRRNTVELIGDNLRLGRDQTLAQIVLPERSVSRLHARITEELEGIFFLYDEGSTSGTWVNYRQIPVIGHQLVHGDLINLGRVQLRYMTRPQAAPPPARAAAPATPPPDDHSTEPFAPLTPSRSQVTPPAPTRPGANALNDLERTEGFNPADAERQRLQQSKPNEPEHQP